MPSYQGKQRISGGTVIQRKLKSKIPMGALNCPITILKREQSTDDSTGQTIFVFTEHKRVRAKIETSIAGMQVFDGVNTMSNVSHIIYIVYQPITTEYRIRYIDEMFKILSVENINYDNTLMRLLCTDRGLDMKQATYT